MAVTNEEEFEAWLKEQEQPVRTAIAARASLRAYPSTLRLFDDDAHHDIALLTGRAILTSAVAVLSPTADVKGAANSAAQSTVALLAAGSIAKSTVNSAARSAVDSTNSATSAAHFVAHSTVNPSARSVAYSAANSAANSAGSAGRSAALSARSAALSAPGSVRSFAHSSAAYSAARSAADSAAFKDSTEDTATDALSVFQTGLWHGDEILPAFKADWDRFAAENAASSSDWAFWVKWYQGMLAGEPLDWELQRRVALIPDDVWEAGVGAVATAIRAIEAELVSENLPQAEEVSRDPETGLYDIEPIVVDQEVLLESALSQIDFSLDMAISGGNTSGFGTMCTPFRYVRHTIDNCLDDPNAIEGNFSIASKLISDGLASGQYQTDAGLEGLLLALDRNTVQLRGQHPEIRTAWETRVAQRLREATAEQRLGFADALQDMRPGTQNRLNEEFELDADAIRKNESEEATAEATKRSGSRAAAIAIKERTEDAIKKADGSAVYKGYKLANAAGKAVEYLSGLFF